MVWNYNHNLQPSCYTLRPRGLWPLTTTYEYSNLSIPCKYTHTTNNVGLTTPY